MGLNKFHKILIMTGIASIVILPVIAFVRSHKGMELNVKIKYDNSTDNNNAYADSNGNQNGSQTRQQALPVENTSVQNGQGKSSYATGIYKDVYNYLDTLNVVQNRQIAVEQDADGMYSMTNCDDSCNFRVLQLTDIHMTGADSTYQQDMQAIEAVYSMVERNRPDLIVMTGDLINAAQDSDLQEGLRAFDVLCRLMDKISIPWTWTFGNHDHSFFDRYSPDEIAAMLKNSKTLYMYGKDVSISGYSKGVFALCNHGGSLNNALILLDSQNVLRDENGTISGYDYVKDDQVNWYEKQILRLQDKYGENAKTMLFLHIPLKEYDDAWNQVVNDKSVDGNSNEAVDENMKGTAVYLFGGKNEEVSCSPVRSGLFEKAVALGSTVAIFCGHDHLNDFSIRYRGIQLVYGKSIDYTAYSGIAQKTAQRGATLITFASDGTYAVIPELFQYEGN